MGRFDWGYWVGDSLLLAALFFGVPCVSVALVVWGVTGQWIVSVS